MQIFNEGPASQEICSANFQLSRARAGQDEICFCFFNQSMDDVEEAGNLLDFIDDNVARPRIFRQ
jgi:hypothetical protein